MTKESNAILSFFFLMQMFCFSMLYEFHQTWKMNKSSSVLWEWNSFTLWSSYWHDSRHYSLKRFTRSFRHHSNSSLRLIQISSTKRTAWSNLSIAYWRCLYRSIKKMKYNITSWSIIVSWARSIFWIDEDEFDSSIIIKTSIDITN
jgi:hypothetical protein